LKEGTFFVTDYIVLMLSSGSKGDLTKFLSQTRTRKPIHERKFDGNFA